MGPEIIPQTGSSRSVLVTKYYSSGACGGEKRCIRELRKYKWKSPLAKSKYRGKLA
jgi:hypothetical protein